MRVAVRPAAITIVLLSLAAWMPPQAPEYDVIIRNGRILDGTGNPHFYADIGIRGDVIARVGDLRNARARRDVDARGQYVTPGWFAMHEHIEPDILAGHGTLPNFTTQGFTTAVIDADGRTHVWPIAKAKADYARAGSALNLVPMVGHATVRAIAMGTDFRRAATAAEIERMKALTKEGMEQGAFGLTTGLEYSPARWSTEGEVLEIAKVVAPFGGHYQSHLRSQGQYPKWQTPSTAKQQFSNIDAVTEAITIAKEAGIPAMLDHLHPKGPREWGSGKIITGLVDRAWRDGLEVYINMHSYEAYDETIVLVPRWALIQRQVEHLGQFDGSHPTADYTDMRGSLRRRLAIPDTARLIRTDIAYEIDRGGGPDGLLVMDYPDKSWVGKTLAQVARMRNEDPVETALHIQLHGFDRPGGIEWRAFAVSLDDLKEFMRKDYTAVCTDRRGDGPRARQNQFIHPGTFGTSVRRVRRFVIDEEVTTMPFAIRSMTSLSAQILGLRDRGRLAEGLKADVVVFDPETLEDKATYFDPFQYSTGINFVLVNGQFVVEGGKPTAAKPGKVLERQRTTPRPSAR